MPTINIEISEVYSRDTEIVGYYVNVSSEYKRCTTSPWGAGATFDTLRQVAECILAGVEEFKRYDAAEPTFNIVGARGERYRSKPEMSGHPRILKEADKITKRGLEVLLDDEELIAKAEKDVVMGDSYMANIFLD